MRRFQFHWPVWSIIGLLIVGNPTFLQAETEMRSNGERTAVTPSDQTGINQEEETRPTAPNLSGTKTRTSDRNRTSATNAEQKVPANPPGSPVYERDMKDRFPTSEEPGENAAQKSKHVGS